MNLDYIIEKYLINEAENKKDNLLSEMTCFTKRDTGLPMNIWIDDLGDARRVPHDLPRLKFQKTKKDKILRVEMVPISITVNPEILLKNFKVEGSELSIQDIKKLKEWIRLNLNNLLKVYTQDMSITEFIPTMKKI